MLRDSLKKYRKKLYEEGRIDGRLECKKEGKKEGIELTNIETARKMLKLNFSINDISAVIGFSAKEIEKLREE